MQDQCLLPIIQADSVDDGLAIAAAMQQADIRLVEVVLRTPASLQVLKAIKQQLPDLIVGAGTVVDEQSLKAALEAGSDFIVTPAISPDFLKNLAAVDVPVLPGVSNTGDILMAREYGFKELKLFPANLSGGYQFIKALGSIFPDLAFCPTGGVSEANKMDYLQLDNCFAVGGTWIAKKEWVSAREFAKITESCLAANKKAA